MDRFFRGFVAGSVGGLAMNAWTLFAVSVLNLNIIRFIDWAAIIMYGDFPQTHAEGAFAFLMQILWSGLLGIAFGYLIPQISSRGYILKGAIFGLLAGFIIYAIPTLLQMPLLKAPSFETVLSNHTGGLVWGLVTAATLGWLEKSSLLKHGAE